MGLYENVERMWFGTEQKMGWIETPQTGADVSSLGQSANATLLGGGGVQRNSWDSHKTYQFSWGVGANQSMVSLLQAYRNGSYGRGLLYFHDPMFFGTNLLPKRWADPSMAVNFEAEPLIPDTNPAAVPVVSTPNNYPVNAARYALPASYSSQSNSTELFFPIPEDMVLVLGAVYSEAGRVYVRTPAGSTDLIPMGLGDATVVNTVIRNQPWARIGIRNPDASASSITISGMTARLVKSVPAGEGEGFSYTNLAPNPSFEAGGGGTVEVRRNHAVTPRPTAYAGSTWGAPGDFQGTPEAGWLGGTLTAPTTPYIFSATSARAYAVGERVTLSIRYRVTAANAGAAQHIAVIPHVRTGNAYYRGSHIVVRPMIVGQDEDVVIQWTTSVEIAAGNLDIAMVGSNAAGTGLSTADAGFGFQATRALIEDGWTDGAFFDGAFSPDADLAPAWTGAAGASASILNGTRPGNLNAAAAGLVLNAYRTQVAPSCGTYAARWVVTTSAAVSVPISDVLPTPGQQYRMIFKARSNSRTLSVTPRIGATASPDNVTLTQGQWVDISVSLTATTANAQSTGLYIAPGQGQQYGDTIDIDCVSLVAGDYSGPQFDGSSAGAVWNGTPNASTSTWSGTTPISGDIGAGPWFTGEGHSGCRFDGNPTVINYNGVGGGQIGLSANFVEVGAWE